MNVLKVAGLSILAVGAILLLDFLSRTVNPDVTAGDLGILGLLLGGLVLAAGSLGKRASPRGQGSSLVMVGWLALSVGLLVAIAALLLLNQTPCMCTNQIVGQRLACSCGASFGTTLDAGVLVAVAGAAGIVVGASRRPRLSDQTALGRGPTRRRVFGEVALAMLVVLSLFFVTAGNVIVTGKTPLWVYRSSGTINSIAMDENGSFIAVGVGFTRTSGALLLFNSGGKLLWERQTDRILSGLTISGNGSRIVANGYQLSSGEGEAYENSEVYAFDSNGSLLWTRTSSGSPSYAGMSGTISANASRIIVTTPGSVALLTWGDQVLWNYSAPPIYPTGNLSVPETNTNPAVFVSQNGSRVAAGAYGVTMLGSGEDSIWTYQGFNPISGSRTALTSGVSLIASWNNPSLANGTVLFLTGNGTLLWKHYVSSNVLSAALLPSGSSVGYVTNSGDALFYDRSGTLLANYTAAEETELLPTADGTFLLAGGGQGDSLVLFNSVGRVIWSSPFQSDLTAAVSEDGAFAAAASGLSGQGGTGFPSTLYFFSTTGNGSLAQGVTDKLTSYSQSSAFVLFVVGTGITTVALFVVLAVMFARGRKTRDGVGGG